jgi:hypothetical protein
MTPMIAREKVEAVIGKGFADKLDGQVFTIGEWFYTRREMVEQLGCANFMAAARLQKVLRKLGIKTPAQLSKLDPFSLARARGIGEASLFVAMCILDSKGYDVLKWWGFNENSVKFSSFKAHAIQRASKRKQEVE